MKHCHNNHKRNRLIYLAAFLLMFSSTACGLGTSISMGTPTTTPSTIAITVPPPPTSTITLVAPIATPITMKITETDVWSNQRHEGAVILALAIDPTTPTTIYAGTLGDGVFKSTDGGEHWSQAITGMTEDWI
jgi:hypothetical protein